MRAALTLTFALLLVACSEMEPFEPPVAGELNPEPGLFTGPTGEFVLHRSLGEEAAEFGPEAAPQPAPAPPPRRRLTDPPPP
jgi:hypothetical protein